MNKIEKIENYNNQTFEDIKHIDENGSEYWYARELMPILQYSNWQNFEKIIDKSKISCQNSDISVFEHFTDLNKTIKMPKGAEKTILDYKLSRYACYLIAQNGDSRKRVISLAQTYFAIQTHYEVGSKIRKTIKELGGTMPEDLLTPKKSLKQLEKENKKSLKKY